MSCICSCCTGTENCDLAPIAAFYSSTIEKCLPATCTEKFTSQCPPSTTNTPTRIQTLWAPNLDTQQTLEKLTNCQGGDKIVSHIFMVMSFIYAFMTIRSCWRGARRRRANRQARIRPSHALPVSLRQPLVPLPAAPLPLPPQPVVIQPVPLPLGPPQVISPPGHADTASSTPKKGKEPIRSDGLESVLTSPNDRRIVVQERGGSLDAEQDVTEANDLGLLDFDGEFGDIEMGVMNPRLQGSSSGGTNSLELDNPLFLPSTSTDALFPGEEWDRHS